MSRSEIDIIYESYRNQHDNIILKDGVRFYRIVCSHRFTAEELRNHLKIILPWEYMKEVRKDKRVQSDSIWIDENGNRYRILSSAFIRFSDTVPEWYLKCGVFSVKWIDTPDIGKYIGVRI